MTAPGSSSPPILSNLPPDDTATVYLSPIKTVRTAGIELRNPTIEVNDQALTIPVSCRLPGQPVRQVRL